MRKYAYFRSLVLALFGSFVLTGCAVNPVTGQQQLMLLSEQGESQLGRSSDQSIVAQYGIYADSALQSYLQTMGQTMGSNSYTIT